jgi:hypothetical protein
LNKEQQILFQRGKDQMKAASLVAAAFTVPLFDEFMRPIMPGDRWQE